MLNQSTLQNIVESISDNSPTIIGGGALLAITGYGLWKVLSAYKKHKEKQAEEEQAIRERTRGTITPSAEEQVDFYQKRKPKKVEKYVPPYPVRKTREELEQAFLEPPK